MQLNLQIEERIRQIVREEIAARDQRIKELESDLLLCKKQMVQTLQVMSDKFAEELVCLMDNHQVSLQAVTEKLLRQYSIR